ncbi:MAG: metal ABC transporter substrate-binding protein [candidate division KSB1 bacterium]|nr:metal ABC transporter substrate-binding protein [candidate division KSB1 bacterium]
MYRSSFYFLVLLLLTHCSAPDHEPERPVVAVSIRPLTDFTQQIGGEYVDVFTVIPAGSNPHTFELSPALMRKIVDSELLVLNGLGLEYWADKVRENADETTVLVTTRVLHDFLETHHGHGSDDHHYNPHVWLDPVLAVQQVKQICDALSELDPEHANEYELKADSLITGISKLDTWIETQVSGWSQKRFVTFHPAWFYFARRYGLEIAGVIEKRPGAEPTPGDIREIIQQVEAIDAKAVFTEAQFPSKVAEMIANESGVSVIALDPLGATGRETYVDIMTYNVQQMARGLQ